MSFASTAAGLLAPVVRDGPRGLIITSVALTVVETTSRPPSVEMVATTPQL